MLMAMVPVPFSIFQVLRFYKEMIFRSVNSACCWGFFPDFSAFDFVVKLNQINKSLSPCQR